MDAINEQSWLLPLLLPLKGGVCQSSRARQSTFVPMRVIVIQFAGEGWPGCEVVTPGRCELWLRPGLVSFRGHRGLKQGERQLPLPGPLCFLLAKQIALREVAGGDDWQRGGGRELLEEKARSSVGEAVLGRSSMF